MYSTREIKPTNKKKKSNIQQEGSCDQQSGFKFKQETGKNV
jgi:hypothetical protein